MSGPSGQRGDDQPESGGSSPAPDHPADTPAGTEGQAYRDGRHQAMAAELHRGGAAAGDRPRGRPRTGTQMLAAALVALAGLAVLTLAPAGLALGWDQFNERQNAQEAAARLPVGAPVQDGPATFVVHEVRCGPDEEQARHGKLCLATVTARNDGAEQLPVPEAAQRLHGPEGVRHPPTEQGAGELGTLDPGQSTTAVIEFDVPDHATILGVRVHADTYSPGTAVFLTGAPLPLPHGS